MTKANTTHGKSDQSIRKTEKQGSWNDEDPRAGLGLSSPLSRAETEREKAGIVDDTPNTDEGDEINPRLETPASPGQYRSGVDDPGNPNKKNPGHTNAAHNTPGHQRKDQPGRQNTAQPGQAQSQSYPGIAGKKARALIEN